MGLADAVAKVTDPYERKARLFPALLAGLPAIVMVIVFYGSNSVISTASTVAVSSGALYLLGNLARERGKRLEAGLFQTWGGKPTTQLLRHRDNTIERPTKQRYHKFLSEKINLDFPADAAEAADPTSADEVYQSAVRWLLNHTRDKKQFNLLFEDNVAYGFRRNGYALRRMGIVACSGTILWILMREYMLVRPLVGNAFTLCSGMSEQSWVCLVTSALMLLVWLSFFSESTVRTAAFTYAETLLRACDKL